MIILSLATKIAIIIVFAITTTVLLVYRYRVADLGEEVGDDHKEPDSQEIHTLPGTPKKCSAGRRKRNSKAVVPPQIEPVPHEEADTTVSLPMDVVKTFTAQIKTLTAQIKTLTAQVKTLTAQGSYLLGVHVQSIGPIYTSLLLKGVAAHIFWHSENLYPVEVQLSVSQLTYLNHELERLHTASHDAMSAARQIFARYRSGPPSQPPHKYSGARITTTFPSLSLPLQHSILGNGPREEKNVFDEKGQQLILTKVNQALNSRNCAAHEASAQQLAEFLISIRDDADLHFATTGIRKPHLIADFHLLVKCYRFLFGFPYTAVNDGTQLLTNSGSLETVADDSENEEEVKPED